MYTAVDSLPLCATKVSNHVLQVSQYVQCTDSQRKLLSSMYDYSLPTGATTYTTPEYATADDLPTCTTSPSTYNRETQSMYYNSLLAGHTIVSQLELHSQCVLQQSPRHVHHHIITITNTINNNSLSIRHATVSIVENFRAGLPA